jgi:hypothetical protein
MYTVSPTKCRFTPYHFPGLNGITLIINIINKAIPNSTVKAGLVEQAPDAYQ